MLDFILHRYNSVDYILEMNFKNFFDLYLKAAEKETEDRMFAMYCALLPNFNQDNYMTFTEFKNQNKKTSSAIISDGGKTDEENIEYAESIIRMELQERK